MRRASGNAALSANQMASGMGPSWSQSGAIIAAFKNLFPQHTRKTLADFLGLSDGAARKKLTGERALSVDELATLLRSEHGLDFLAAIMTGAEPMWWHRAKAYFAAIDAQRLQRATRRKLREVIDADTAISADIERADALLVQDEDFYGRHVDALRAASRAPHRPLARKHR